MASEKKLSEISESLNSTLRRIDTLKKQSDVSWSSKFRQHLAKNNQHLNSIILAGCVLAVAGGRLQQKNEFEVQNDPCIRALDPPCRETVVNSAVRKPICMPCRLRSRGGRKRKKDCCLLSTGT